MADPVVVEVASRPVIVAVTVRPVRIEIKAGGPPGRQGDPGTPGVDGEDDIRARQHDLVANLDYCGVAPVGSATSAAVWTITRLTIDAGGAVTATAYADANPAAVWDDRLTIPYT